MHNKCITPLIRTEQLCSFSDPAQIHRRFLLRALVQITFLFRNIYQSICYYAFIIIIIIYF